jgi:hypothetical protein
MTVIRRSANAAAGPRGCPEMRVCAVVIVLSECMPMLYLSSGNPDWAKRVNRIYLAREHELSADQA